MKKYPDSFYAVSPCVLWQAAKDGWIGAIEALVDRFAYEPPVISIVGHPGDPGDPAARWANLLTRDICPF